MRHPKKKTPEGLVDVAVRDYVFGMRKILIALTLFCVSSPALAAQDCPYVSTAGSLQFSNFDTHSFTGETEHVLFRPASGGAKTCTYLLQDEDSSFIACPGESQQHFSFENNARDYSNANVLTFQGVAWHKKCSTPA